MILLHGLRWHFVQASTDPLVVLMHGFPCGWYGRRKVLPALAGAGYRVVALDPAGYGCSDMPAATEHYTHLLGVGDPVALLAGLQESSPVLVDHDVEASIANAAAQLRPDLFAALVLPSMPPSMRAGEAPADGWRAFRERTGRMFYREYFAGEDAVRELDADLRRSLRAPMFSISGQAEGLQRCRRLIAPREGFLDTVFDPPKLPSWPIDRVLYEFIVQYARHGLRCALGSYRARTLNWEWSALLAESTPVQLSLFIGGGSDPAADRLPRRGKWSSGLEWRASSIGSSLHQTKRARLPHWRALRFRQPDAGQAGLHAQPRDWPARRAAAAGGLNDLPVPRHFSWRHPYELEEQTRCRPSRPADHPRAGAY